MVRIALSVLGAAVVFAAPLGYRFGVVPLGPALLALVVGVALSVVGLVLGVIVLVRWSHLGGVGGTLCLMIAAAASLVPIWAVISNVGAPAIHDITTDTNDPPEFVDVIPLRRGSPNTIDYAGPDLAAAQTAAYPNLRPLRLRGSVEQVVRAAQAVAEQLGWEVVSSEPVDGRLEATDTTFWFGFKDDVVVRVKPDGDDRVRIDVRSVSRVGQGDLGANAARIQQFLSQLEAASL